jgi:hypothetical protein
MRTFKTIVPWDMSLMELMHVTMLLNSACGDVQVTLDNGCEYLVTYDRLKDYENQIKMYNKNIIITNGTRPVRLQS